MDVPLTWKQANRVYALPEPKIPAIDLSSTLMSTAQRAQDNEHGGCNHDRGRSYNLRCGATGRESATVEGSLSKSDILNAEVINQVDRKFIACLVNTNSSDVCREGASHHRTLVLVDQHAADERIRVEKFLQELCLGFSQTSSVGCRQLSPPVHILLTRHEASRLARSSDIRRVFERWGIRFVDLPEEGRDSSDDDYVQVAVSTVPDVVSEKVRIMSHRERG